MKSKLVLALAVVFSFVYGCSNPRHQIIERSTDLGIVEVADRETRLFPLSGGGDCRLTFTTLANGNVLVEAVVLGKDANGNLKIVARPRAEANFGQKVTLPIADGIVVLIPKQI